MVRKSEVLRTVGEGLLWAAVVIALLVLSLPSDILNTSPPTQSGAFYNDYARRWDGQCHGWTKPLALIHIIGDTAIFTAYVVICIAIIRRHPILARVPYHKLTVPLISLVFLTCGLTHLFEAYTTFQPVYRISGVFKCVTGAIGIAGAFFITHNLIAAFDKISIEQTRLRKLEAQLADQAV